ncbi:HPr family phosphocarrier protein [Gluconobacter kondonii]|uniref:HPr family phosphocarrier protein n=1 Tax=Gluconobacter TaxID=441 RepID=UPI001B8C7CE0|nr:HPr family phosphocarrier protein [Gluconobacter kondonii]MBS1077195.1 HPr family phosphocarrier protein [Gluconobacter kondonii]MBS1082176.1 HPr family phosphocarrier protein [Gluconobacter kondonii]
MSDTTLSVPPRTVSIVNHLGLHARPAAKIVTTAECFDAEATIAHGSNVVSALSIMGLMMLGAGEGQSVTLRAHGPQAVEVLNALEALIADGFGERD